MAAFQLMMPRSIAAAVAGVAMAAFFRYLYARRRRNPYQVRVDLLNAERVDLRRRKRKALQDVNLHGRWFCDVKASGCCIASVDQWPPANGDRFHCLRGCNFDACSNCAPLVHVNHLCGSCGYPLQLRPMSLTNTEKRNDAVNRRDATRRALQANAAALVEAEHHLVMRQASISASKLLEAAAAAAAAATRAFDAGARERVVPELRTALRLSCEAAMSGSALIEDLVDHGPASSRKGFLRSLPELIPAPRDGEFVTDGTGGEWRAEWAALTAEWAELTDQAHLRRWLKQVSDVDRCISTHATQIEVCIAAGWHPEHAAAVWLLQSRIRALSRALRERDGRYACSLYTLTRALTTAAAGQPAAAPLLFVNLSGKFGLVANDDQWQRLEVADRFGFRGLSSTAMVKASRSTLSFAVVRDGAEVSGGDGGGRGHGDSGHGGSGHGGSGRCEVSGFAVRVTRTRPVKEILYEVQDAPVVCFESAPASASSLHSAIMVSDDEGFFPPNCLYRLTSISPSFVAPNGLHIKQKLYTVSATYRPPPGASTSAGGSDSAKLCASKPVQLTYADRAAYVAGLDDVLSKPLLLMEQEFDREMAWVDYKGQRHVSRECWQYVVGVASTLPGCTPGVRDANNGGKRPEDFLREANELIFQRRKRLMSMSLNVAIATNRWKTRAGSSVALSAGASAVPSVSPPTAPPPVAPPASQPAKPSAELHVPLVAAKPTSMMADEHALLTLDEVLALRLYSGPAFQPINCFLRQIATLNGKIRTELAHHPALTFAATVAHLCSGIRKLAAVATSSEVGAPVWRGVRGALPKGFFEPDAHGHVAAVEMGFMSCSKRRHTPIEYMGAEGENVLWTILQSGEDDEGFHSGADISILSQFAAEEEVLFPPVTQLLVLQRQRGDDGHTLNMAGALVHEETAQTADGDTKNFFDCTCRPSFV